MMGCEVLEVVVIRFLNDVCKYLNFDWGWSFTVIGF